MIILASHSSNGMAIIYSGLLAAIISGGVSLIGYGITAYFQNKNNKDTIRVQKEIAKMGREEKLFYETQLATIDETRNLIAKFIKNCIAMNRAIKRFNEKEVDDAKNIDDARNIFNSKKESFNKLEKISNELQEQITLIRLNIFDKDDNLGNHVLKKIYEMEKFYTRLQPIPSEELDIFVDIVRDYFYKQIKELKNKTA